MASICRRRFNKSGKKEVKFDRNILHWGSQTAEKHFSTLGIRKVDFFGSDKPTQISEGETFVTVVLATRRKCPLRVNVKR